MFGSILSRVLGFTVCIAAFVAVAMATTNFFRIDRAIESALIGVGMLALAAERLGETAEYERCAQFLRDSDPAAADALA